MKGEYYMSEEIQTNEQNKNICSKCNKEVAPEDVKMYVGEDGKTPECICDECAEKIKEEYYLATQNVNVFKGLLFGIVASVITGAIWYWIAVFTHTLYDIVILGIGFIIALACSIGAGNKKGWKVQTISILLTLITIFYAEGLFAYHTVIPESILHDGIIVFIINIIILPLFALKSLGFIGFLLTIVAIYVAFAVAKKDELKLAK